MKTKLFILSTLIFSFTNAIAGTSNYIDAYSDSCVALSPAMGAGGNTFISGSSDRIHIVITPNGKVIAQCRFGDTSGVYEDEAEQQKIDGDCGIFAANGDTLVDDGSGHVVVGANGDGGPDGNATIVCKGQLID